MSQVGSFPQVGVKRKHIWNHHPNNDWIFNTIVTHLPTMTQKLNMMECSYLRDQQVILLWPILQWFNRKCIPTNLGYLGREGHNKTAGSILCGHENGDAGDASILSFISNDWRFTTPSGNSSTKKNTPKQKQGQLCRAKQQRFFFSFCQVGKGFHSINDSEATAEILCEAASSKVSTNSHLKGPKWWGAFNGSGGKGTQKMVVEFGGLPRF